MKLFKLPEKKFRVRVIYYGGWINRWNVQYTYYRFIPIWNTINKYYESTNDWSDKIFMLSKNAEEFAYKLNSIEDVYKYYQEAEKEEIEYNRKQKELYPYKVKYIK